MVQKESFKRRVRSRMAKTGERYAAARAELLKQSKRKDGRVWLSPPEMSDDAIRRGTKKGWDEWCELIDAWPGNSEGHAAIAAWVHDEFGVDHWWAQGVTVGYERITGRRLPNQRSDGLFGTSKTKTVAIQADELRALLIDASNYEDLFTGCKAELRSKPATKVIRIAIEPGMVLFTLTPASGGRTAVNVAHEKLPDVEAVDRWRFYWAEWLDALDR